MAEPIRYSTYKHPIGINIYSDSAAASQIIMTNMGLHLDDAKDYCAINNRTVEAGWQFSYCPDQTMHDFFQNVILIF